MALLAGLLGIASMLLIANTIRLSLYARRREVEVMKLVGATDWFIRWPFVLEGVIVGAVGGVLAILLLAVVKIAVVDPLAADFALIAAPDTIDFPLLIGLLLLAAVSRSPRWAPASACGSSYASSHQARPHRRGAPRRAPRRGPPARRSPTRPRCAAARSSSSRPPRPYASPVVRASVTPSVKSTSDSRSPSSNVTSSSFGSGTQPSTEPGWPTGSTSPPRRITNGIGCPAQQIVARADPLSSTAAQRDRAVAPAAFVALAQQRAVDDVQHAARAVLVLRGGAERVADLRRQRRGARALAGDVADHEIEPVLVRQHVVEVAADQAAVARRAVARREVHALQRRQPLREESLLERTRDRAEVLVQARVVDRERGAPREVLGQHEVLPAVLAPGGERREDDRAPDRPARLQRHDHRRRGPVEPARLP